MFRRFSVYLMQEEKVVDFL